MIPAEPSTGGGMSAMRIRDVVAMVNKLNGGQFEITERMIRDDIESGAPANGDGTVNILHYCAWLVGNGLRQRG
jgi:hypothetical protein